MKNVVIAAASALLLSIPFGIVVGCGGSPKVTTTSPTTPVTPVTPGNPSNPTSSPAQSPMAAFLEQEGSGERSIYTATNDGSGLTTVSGPSRGFNSVYVLPDGSKGVFAARVDDGYSQIFYLAPFSSNATPIQLTTTPSHKTGAMLSADGSQITFMQERSGQVLPEEYSFDIAVMNADGSNLHVLPLPFGLNFLHPFFSPDGSKITGAISMMGCFGECSVFTVNVDGTDFTRITPGGADGILAVAPAFSPDGKQVVFSSVGWGDVSLYIVNSDGSGLQRLGWTNAGWGDPLYVAGRLMFVGNNQIYSMKPDGTDVKLVTGYAYAGFDMPIL